MATLNAWQRPDYVLNGKIWGDYKDGSPTVSSCPNTYSAGTASINQKNGTCASANLANGDLFIAIQMQGTGAGNWQFNMVASGGGTTSIVCKKDFKYDFVSGAQFVKVPRYAFPTISAHSVTPWDGTKGGLEAFCVKAFAPSGTINIAGTAGGLGNPVAGATGGGFRGGTSGTKQTPSQGYQGEGYLGGLAASTSANGSAPGGCRCTGDYDSGGGTGGAYVTQGEQGGGGNVKGALGATYGSADLTTIFLGTGGSGAARGAQGGSMGSGGSGGGMLIIFTKEITSAPTISANGGAGGGGDKAGGGGGSGGSVLIVCGSGNLGSNTITALAGARGPSPGDTSLYGGAGSVGRIAVHHSGTVTGTTNPTFTDVTDATLKEKPKGGAFLLNFV